MPHSPPTSPGLPNDPVDRTDCPLSGQLDAFLSEQLPPDAAEKYLQHLTSCPRCQELAEARLNTGVWQRELLSPAAPEVRTTVVRAIHEVVAQPATHSRTEFQTEWFPVAPGPAPPIAPAGCMGRILANRFELRRTVAVGGYGTVFEAWDQRLRREVAIKLPHWPLFESMSVRKRFAVEARAAARLSHPNIVPVYEALIEESGECFLVSEFVRGPSLEAWLDEQHATGQNVPVRRAARIIAELASGVEFAHAAGVLHRDLKPSNVLLAPATEGALPFVPRITDFGLARLTDETNVSSVEGKIFGSLQYMSPEQASGSRDVDPESDVYSLGVMLYELLTGKLPIMSESIPALLEAIPTRPVEPPRRWRNDVAADLEAICLKCLEKRPQDRYRTAGELALDLRRYLADEAVSVRFPGRHEQLARKVRRNPAVTTVLSMLVVAVLAVLGVLADANRKQGHLIDDLQRSDQGLKIANEQLGTSNNRLNVALQTAEDMRRRAVQMRRQAEVQQKKTQESLYVSEFRRAMQALADQDLPLLQIVLDKLDQPEFDPYRGVECGWLRTKLVRPHRELLRFPRAAYTIAFSHDGGTLAAGGRDSVVKLVRFADGTPIAEWETLQKEVNGLAFVADSQRLWTSGDDGSLCQWDVSTRKELLRLPAHAPGQAHDLLAVPHLELLLSTGTDGRILLWNPLTGERRGELPGNGNTVIAAALHPDGRHLYSITRDEIWRWDLVDQTLASKWRLSARPLSMFLSRDGRWLLSSVENYRLEIRDSVTGSVFVASQLSDHVRKMLQVPESEKVYAVDDRGTWREISLPVPGSTPPDEVESRVVGRYFDGRSYNVKLSPDRHDLVSCGSDGRVLTWRVASLNPPEPSDQRIGLDTALCFSSDDRGVIFSDLRRLLRLDLDSLQRDVLFDFSPRICRKLCVLPDGDLLTGETDDEKTDWLVHRRRGDCQPIAELGFGAGEGFGGLQVDDRLGLVFVEKDLGRNLAWRFLTLHPLQELTPLRVRGSTHPAAFSSVSGRLALNDRHAIEIRDLTTRNIEWRQALPESLESLSASPDGRYLASATADRIIRIWDLRTGEQISEMTGHGYRVTTMVFSANGRTLFSGEDGGSGRSEVRIWHVATGDLLGILHSQKEYAIKNLLLSRANDRLLVHHDIEGLLIVPLKLKSAPQLPPNL